ncbi:MAG: HepT-like ribonuclease domain-containing protein [Candidatus Bathyarchaeia archaeon]
MLRDRDLISTEECNELIKLLGLRNLLVHRY